MKRDVDSLVDRLDVRFGPPDWFLYRGLDGDEHGWFLGAGWTRPQSSPDDGGWSVTVEGKSIREVLVRGLWVSR